MQTGQRKSVSFLFLWFAPTWYFLHLQKVYSHRLTFIASLSKSVLNGPNLKKLHKLEMRIRQQYLLELPRTTPCAKSQLDFRPLIIETDGEMLSSECWAVGVAWLFHLSFSDLFRVWVEAPLPLKLICPWSKDLTKHLNNKSHFVSLLSCSSVLYLSKSFTGKGHLSGLAE